MGRPAGVAALRARRSRSRAGAHAGHVYLYKVGQPTIAGTVDLSGLDYSDTTVWEHVDLTAVASGVQAYTKDSSIFSTGVLTLTATGSQSIIATVLAGAAGVGGGGTTGVAVTAAGAFAQNDIASDVKAYIDGDRVRPVLAGRHHRREHHHRCDGLLGRPGDRRRCLDRGASVGGTTGIAFSVGFSMALNQVANAVEAAIKNANPGVTTTSGGVSLTATVAGLPLFDTSDAGLTPGALDDASFADTDDPGRRRQRGDGRRAGRRPVTLALLATKFTGLYSLSSGWKLDVIRPGSVWQVTDGLLGFRTFIVTLDAVTGALHVSAPTIEAIVLAASVAASFGGDRRGRRSAAPARSRSTTSPRRRTRTSTTAPSRAHTGVSLDGDGHERDLRGRARRLRRGRRRRNGGRRRVDRHRGRDQPDRRDALRHVVADRDRRPTSSAPRSTRRAAT